MGHRRSAQEHWRSRMRECQQEARDHDLSVQIRMHDTFGRAGSAAAQGEFVDVIPAESALDRLLVARPDPFVQGGPELARTVDTDGALDAGTLRQQVFRHHFVIAVI